MIFSILSLSSLQVAVGTSFAGHTWASRLEPADQPDSLWAYPFSEAVAFVRVRPCVEVVGEIPQVQDLSLDQGSQMPVQGRRDSTSYQVYAISTQERGYGITHTNCWCALIGISATVLPTTPYIQVGVKQLTI